MALAAVTACGSGEDWGEGVVLEGTRTVRIVIDEAAPFATTWAAMHPGVVYETVLTDLDGAGESCGFPAAATSAKTATESSGTCPGQTATCQTTGTGHPLSMKTRREVRGGHGRLG